MKQLNHLRWSVKSEQLYVLNLDAGFNPFDGMDDIFYLDHKTLNFLGGEPHLQILSPADVGGDLIITQRVKSPLDFMNIILANDAARRMGFTRIKLFIPYFPAARQDRVCNTGEPLTVKVFADMINNCNFDEVMIYSAHSEVTVALLNNVKELDRDFEYVQGIVLANSEGHHFNIVCPDAGAGKRVGKIVQQLANGDPWRTYHLIRCEKIRDVKDGSLKEFFVQDDDLNGYPTLIVDDVNSMAGTFIGLGKKLREKNCGKLMLFTSHSDCAQGIQNAVENFDKVYTSDSRQNWGELMFTLDGVFECFKLKL